MKTLFVVGYVWPEPRSSAAGSRMMQLLHFFKEEGYNVIFGTTALKTANTEDLESYGFKSISIKLNDPSFDSLLKKITPEIVLFDRFMMEEQFGWRVKEVCPEALQLLDTEDLHFLRKARQEALKSNKKAPLQESETAKREIASIYRCDLSLIISETEIDILQKEFGVPKDLLCYLPFMLKPLTEKNKKDLPTYLERKDFISIGNFKHAPNADAVLVLKREIWPLIKEKIPEAKIHIFGAYVTPAMLQLHDEKEGFLVEGQAGSALAELQKARVLLAPLRFGAGLKGKFIDGMQAGTPNVTTTIGAEGMQYDNFWDGYIEDDPAEFAARAIELYSDEVKWKMAQENGFRIFNGQFSEAIHKARFLKKLQDLSLNLKEHRKSNFTGAMLRHHTMNSTRYLSKYIEIKNQLEKREEIK